MKTTFYQGHDNPFMITTLTIMNRHIMTSEEIIFMSNCEKIWQKCNIASFFHYLTHDLDDFFLILARILSVNEAEICVVSNIS
jgi:hypothetical protein